MALTTYTYSVSLDFPGGKVNLDHLTSEIQASAITIALDRIDLSGDQVGIVFKDDLGAQQSILDGETTHPAGGLIAAHDSSPTVSLPEVNIANKVTVFSRRPEGASRAYVFSVDFCKKQTWYVDAITASDNLTGDGATTTFQLSHGNGSVVGEAILDLCHGLVTDEHLISPPGGAPGGYVPVVTVNGATKVEREAYETSGGDYVIDYASGTVTFETAPAAAAAIVISYYYVSATAGPKMQFRPPVGKKWTIDVAEAQFTADVGMTDTMLQNVFLVGTDFPVSYETRFYNVGNFFDYTYGSFPVIPVLSNGTNRGCSQQTIVLRWDYGAPLVIRHSDNVDVRVWNKHNRAFTGERATIAFYALEEPE